MTTDDYRAPIYDPAFPTPHEAPFWTRSLGVSKREWFAAHAPEPPQSWWGGSNPDCAGYAMWNFQYADAMLSMNGKASAD